MWCPGSWQNRIRVPRTANGGPHSSAGRNAEVAKPGPRRQARDLLVRKLPGSSNLPLGATLLLVRRLGGDLKTRRTCVRASPPCRKKARCARIFSISPSALIPPRRFLKVQPSAEGATPGKRGEWMHICKRRLSSYHSLALPGHLGDFLHQQVHSSPGSQLVPERFL